jgi:hypothetical protein
MFINFGERRINLSQVRQYKPTEKSVSSRTSYMIELLYPDGLKEELHFFDSQDKRNEYLEYLDQNLLPLGP